MSERLVQELYYERGDRIIALEAQIEDANRLLELCLHYLPDGCKASREVKQHQEIVRASGINLTSPERSQTIGEALEIYHRKASNE